MLALDYLIFQKKWKKANILAFKKPSKDKTFPQNYRPISLLPTISKIFERIILNRILDFEEETKNLIPEQFGFRKNKSTVISLQKTVYVMFYIFTLVIRKNIFTFLLIFNFLFLVSL